MKIRDPRRSLISFTLCLTIVACGASAIADDLAALATSDSVCRVMGRDSLRLSRGLTRVIMIAPPTVPGRMVSVGVDTMNHPRQFAAMVTRKSGPTLNLQMVNASYDSI